MKEPETEAECLAALESIGAELIDHDVDSFSVRVKEGGTTKLESDNLYDAAFEAWNLVKPSP